MDLNPYLYRDMGKKFRSFSKRLSLRIILVVLAIMALMAVSLVYWNQLAMKAVSKDHYRVLLDITNDLIENDIKNMDRAEAMDTTGESRKKSLKWLHEWLRQQDVNTNRRGFVRLEEKDKDQKDKWVYSIIVGRDGSYISHPDSLLMGNGNFFRQVQEANNDTISERMISDMKRGVGGEAKVYLDDTRVRVFYEPLKHTEWIMAIIVPKDLERILMVTQSILHAISFLIGLVLIYIVCRITIRRTVRPLHALADSAHEVAKGRFDVPLPEIHHNDEVHLLRDSFEDMQKSLGQYVTRLKATTAEKASIESELAIAKGIQMALVPKKFPPYPERNDIDIYGSMTPAKSVGGDLFDFFIRDEKLLFCIGDVSGKGIPAALVMAITRSLFRNIAFEEQMPERIMTKLNTSLSENNELGWFVTMIVGVLDLASGHLHYCNAGHLPPLLIGNEVSKLPTQPKLPVGALPDVAYTSMEMTLQTGNTLFLFTDGLIEAQNANYELFGNERMLQIAEHVRQKHEDSPKGLISAMTKAVGDFVGEADQSDDLTMLAIRHNKVDTDEDETQTINIEVSTQGIAGMRTFVEQTADRVGLDDHRTRQLRLAIEEAVINVINYSGADEMNLSACKQGQTLCFTLVDNGRPFDPTAVPPPNLSLPGTERQVGGLGIHYIRQMSDSMSYRREDDKNILIITKNI